MIPTPVAALPSRGVRVTRLLRTLVLAGIATRAGAQASDGRPVTAADSAKQCTTIAAGQARLCHLAGPGTKPQERPRAVTHSDLYYTRLKIHRIGSYAMLPLFAAEYFAGDKLLNQDDPAGWVKPVHSTVAAGIGVLFGVNTVTGVWNLWEGRHDSDGRVRRYLHSAAMIAADVGFLMTAQAAGDAGESHSGGDHHRNLALGSIGLSAAGTAMMWFWK